jgi:hypothetical protein
MARSAACLPSIAISAEFGIAPGLFESSTLLMMTVPSVKIRV